MNDRMNGLLAAKGIDPQWAYMGEYSDEAKEGLLDMQRAIETAEQSATEEKYKTIARMGADDLMATKNIADRTYRTAYLCYLYNFVARMREDDRAEK